MKKVLITLVILVPIIALVTAASFGFMYLNSSKAFAANTCTPTGFVRDSINLTAAVIPTGAHPNVSGVVNATGCNIGVYYGPGLNGKVFNADIYGANYFGVVNNGSRVKVSVSRIHDIGETPLNGDQHGVGIYFAFGSSSTGEISGNLIWNYQKGGIVVNSATSAMPIRINQNTVIGQGPVNYIAQNGIQVGFGAFASVTNNTVYGNSYTGSNDAASGGIIVVGGDCYGGPFTTRTQIIDNNVAGNDVGIWLSNLDASCGPATTPTRVNVFMNNSSNDAVNNTTGNFPGPGGYQAGIADQGDFDRIISNSICGIGYTPVITPPPFLFLIDDTVTNHPIEDDNTMCGGGSIGPDSAKVAHGGPGKSRFKSNAVR